MENSTNARNFRNKLSDFFDKALGGPISIARGQDRFVLVEESSYLNLKDEVLSLQKNLISMLQVHEGKSKSFENVEEGINSLFDELSNKRYDKVNKDKKKLAMG